VVKVFGVPSHLTVCRALLDTAGGMSGRQVTRQAGINHQTCVVGLGRVEELGIVWRRGRRDPGGQWMMSELPSQVSGIRVNAIVLAQRVVETRRQRKDPLITNILREGIEAGIDQGKGK